MNVLVAQNLWFIPESLSFQDDGFTIYTTIQEEENGMYVLQNCVIFDALDTSIVSIPVSWKTLLRHVESDVDLEHILSSRIEKAESFSQVPTFVQRLGLEAILGETSHLIKPILDSMEKVSDIAGQVL